MSFRFWRRIRIAPGVTLNLSKSTASLSLGPRGAKYTVSPRGNRATLGLTGTGLFYTVRDSKHSPTQRALAAPVRNPLDLGLIARLRLSRNERVLVDGLRLLQEQRFDAALPVLESVHGIGDAAWLAGMLRIQQEDYEAARRHLQRALKYRESLGSFCTKYAIAAEVTLPITRDVVAHLQPNERATRLTLVEIAQLTERRAEAVEQLERLLAAYPDDPVVLLSFVELALETSSNRALLERVVALTQSLDNDCYVHTALLMYRAQALAGLDLPNAAIDVLTLALRRRKDRPASLLHQLRFDRAVLYEAVGRRAQARREFERLYAENPKFSGLSAKLAAPATH
jgi:tetratricopeptide (TPR) repeat protein